MRAPFRLLAVRPMSNYRLWLRFDDGFVGTVNLESITHIGAFTLLRHPRMFDTVRVDEETGDVRWPAAGVRLCPVILYQDIVARCAGQRVKPAGEDQAFQRYMARAIGAQDGPAEPYLAAERARLDKNARLSKAMKAAWARRRAKGGPDAA